MSEPEPQPAGGYPRNRFTTSFILLALFLIAVAVLNQVGLRGTDGASVSQTALEGNLAAKISYAYERLSSVLPVSAAEKSRILDISRTQRASAIARYQRAVRQSPSPESIRRLIILQEPSARDSAIARLAQIAEGEKSSSLRAEVGMWRDIYLQGDRLAPDQVTAYRTRIQSLRLGWYEHLALTDLYERAWLAHRAQVERAEATRSAILTVVLLFVLVVAVVILGTIGIGLLIWYISARAMSREETPPVEETPPDEEQREFTAGYLLETFLVYLFILVGTQAGAALIVSAGIVPADGITATDSVLITVATYVAAGALALAYLSYRLRKAGWTWRNVWLTSERPWTDILWGIGGYAAALPLLLLASLASQYIGRYVEGPTNPVVPMFVEAESAFARIMLFLLAVVAAPFFEEIFFRGVLFRSFIAKWGVVAGILVSAVAFAAIHPLPVGFLPILVLGVVFAAIDRERKSLLPSMVAHALNNGAAITLLLILTG